MPNPILILIIAQLFFTSSDLLGRYYMSRYGFTWNNFISIWFLIYMVLRIPASLGQLYIFTQSEIGKTISLFSAVSIIFSTLLAFLFFKEVVSPAQYIGISLAVLAFLVLALVK